MITVLSIVLSLQATQVPAKADTLKLEVGSREVDGRVFPKHRARNRVYIGDAKEPATSWTNELELADSAGIPVMRWTTRGQSGGPSGPTWELIQVYNARTLAPLSWARTSSAGAEMRLKMDGLRVHGTKKTPQDAQPQPVDLTLERAGFIASASDLIPMAVGLRKGAVMSAPVWGPNMQAAETRVFTVVGEEVVDVEGSAVKSWKVTEHVQTSGKLVATWWLTDYSPYMVLAEVPLADGRVQRITGVNLKDGEQ